MPCSAVHTPGPPAGGTFQSVCDKSKHQTQLQLADLGRRLCSSILCRVGHGVAATSCCAKARARLGAAASSTASGGRRSAGRQLRLQLRLLVLTIALSSGLQQIK